MSYIERTVVQGARCDKRGCEVTRNLAYATGNFFIDRDILQRLAEADGWTFWVGRSRRMYCPEHGPSMPTGMRRL